MDDMLKSLFEMIGSVAQLIKATGGGSHDPQRGVPDENPQAHKSKKQRIADLEASVVSINGLFSEILETQRQVGNVLSELNHALSVRDETIAGLRRQIETIKTS